MARSPWGLHTLKRATKASSRGTASPLNAWPTRSLTVSGASAAGRKLEGSIQKSWHRRMGPTRRRKRLRIHMPKLLKGRYARGGAGSSAPPPFLIRLFEKSIKGMLVIGIELGQVDFAGVHWIGIDRLRYGDLGDLGYRGVRGWGRLGAPIVATAAAAAATSQGHQGEAPTQEG